MTMIATIANRDSIFSVGSAGKLYKSSCVKFFFKDFYYCSYCCFPSDLIVTYLLKTYIALSKLEIIAYLR